jgi:hypothetical protein
VVRRLDNRDELARDFPGGAAAIQHPEDNRFPIEDFVINGIRKPGGKQAMEVEVKSMNASTECKSLKVGKEAVKKVVTHTQVAGGRKNFGRQQDPRWRAGAGAASFEASTQLGFGILPSNRFDAPILEVGRGACQRFPMPSWTAVDFPTRGEVAPQLLDDL